MLVMMKTGEKLRRLRRGSGLTQAQLAKASGISQASITMIETGEVENPRPATIKALADVLGVSGMDLLDDPEERR
jgi:transcriptional regulator with XRE-family HTH domain